MTMTPPNSNNQNTTSKELEELRARIDAVDTAMQDLLIERSEIVEKVAAVKRGGPTTRPGREATLMRRLVERHRGKFPRRALVQVWREIIVGHSRIQGPYRVAAFAPAENTDFVDLARAHFGASTELSSFASVSQVIAAVTDGKAEVAVLPVPSDGDPDPWWRKIVSGDSKRPRIVTRLPFAARSNGVEALVIAKATPEPTGADRGYFAMETTHDISRSRLSSLLGEAGITPVFWTILPDRGAQDITVNLVEVDGFLGDGDHRLAELAQKEPNAIHWIQVLGSYALPIPESDLR